MIARHQTAVYEINQAVRRLLYQLLIS